MITPKDIQLQFVKADRSARDHRYNTSEAGRERQRRWQASPKGQAGRARHEATRGYLRKRLQVLEADRARVVEQLAEIEKEITCLTRS